MPVYWLPEDELRFPHPNESSPDGLLAVGGDLSPERLLLAYSWGIFPWYSADDPILWWSPDPRFVLFPNDLKVSKSMRPYFNQQKYRVTYDTSFSEVIKACSAIPRDGQVSTWITPEMIQAYELLHKLGYAHSVEVWQDDMLVGGLYGIAMGKVFFGESMFAKATNASKFGFITLVRDLKGKGYQLVDCQQETRHLASMGAQRMKRSEFLERLEKNRTLPLSAGNWKEGVF
ncbi:leucyl/phenylalanyl-tRNA--protein transferase [Lewinella cohaerens]|uniref:leucyl/phenylalanyl-tRNA--protein transferase n=1 Tax=Lewinella cohaerens TaxID=70995 RepID=UPI00037C55EE|nr:leucyl/phenylalanyl-tRNA--protein transferase [Lewinella cohaerens]